MRKIHFITSNKGKSLEAQKLLSVLGYEIMQLEIYYPEIQASSLEEVAEFGIKWLLKEKEVDEAIMIEDAGLFIDALRGFPGIYSAYVFKTLGLDGVLKLLEGEKNRRAYFESCIGYHDKDSGTLLFKGRANGMIALEPRGKYGFGYDPIFRPKDKNKTFAEMPTEEKNKHSHRAKSLAKLAKHLSKR